MVERIRLFPLRTVLFPGGPLQLRIFETRYLELVSYCLRENACFGVCLIRDGQEAGKPAIPFQIGTMARIIDWEKRQDGLLGITVVGEQRFRLLDTSVSDSGLLTGHIERLDDPLDLPAPRQPEAIDKLLDRVMQIRDLGYHLIEDQRDRAHWLGCRLAEVMPLELPERQQLLETHDPMERLRLLKRLLPDLEV
ncbi:LON peptidase substrate-binding domain-containing protein [Methylonatrum kenyense]|uniref:LON peptidase substrate-binding domain-containing protein n=1 Tax=Methylonatrum kenyense TaxID=455253 RepID=UPI0020BF5975|nr:LON peptidase substrate-binding domain-containing protein [Methylonatrum kenyense]